MKRAFRTVALASGLPEIRHKKTALSDGLVKWWELIPFVFMNHLMQTKEIQKQAQKKTLMRRGDFLCLCRLRGWYRWNCYDVTVQPKLCITLFCNV